MTDGSATALAFALVAGPLLLGYGAGRLVNLSRRSLGRAYAPLACALSLAPLAAAVLAIEREVAVGSWDLLGVGAELGAALALGSLRARGLSWRLALGLVIALAATLLLCELGVRWLLPEPPRFPPPSDARLLHDARLDDPACGQIFGEPRLPMDGPRATTVLHLGDSMIEAVDGRRDLTYPALLQARQSGIRHINTGVASTSTDAQYLILQRWLGRITPSFVVLNLFLGNDIVEIDAQYPCCAGGPLLVFGPEGPRRRCAEAGGEATFGERLLRGPAPYPLRVATSFSHLARHLVARLGAVAARARIAGRDLALRIAASDSDPIATERWAHFEASVRAVAAALRARRIPLLVVVLPFRHELEPAAASPDFLRIYGGAPVVRRRVLALLREAGIDHVDAFEVLREVVQRDGAEPWFARAYPGDIHLSEAGHRRLADWLLPILEARGIRGAPETRPGGPVLQRPDAGSTQGRSGSE